MENKGPVKPEKNLIEKDLSEFKGEVKTHRNSLKKEEDEYRDVKDDDDYQTLLEAGDFTQGDDSIFRRIHILKQKENTTEDVREGIELKSFDKPEDAFSKTENIKFTEDLARGKRVRLKAFTDFYEDDEDFGEDASDSDENHPAHKGTQDRRVIRNKRRERKVEQILEDSRKDIETYVGENLMSKLGVAMIVLAVYTGVNLGINMGIITELGRVFIGLAVGVFLFGVSYRLKERNRTFSSIFLFTGTIVLYYTAFLFFDYYRVQSQALGFSITFAITGIAVGIAVAFDHRRLSLMGILSGYMMPLLLDASVANYSVLFTYLVVLNLACLVIAYLKRWSAVNVITFLASLLWFGTWMLRADMNQMYGTAVFFASMYYLIFFAMNIVYSFMSQTELSRFNFTMLLLNTLFYVLGVAYMVFERGGNINEIGIFAVSLAFFNGVYVYFLIRRNVTDSNLLGTAIGYTLFFLTTSGPILLEPLYLNIFWGLEAMLILWLTLHNKKEVFRYAVVLLFGLSFVSMSWIWFDTYTDSLKEFLFNSAVLTGFITIMIFALSATMMNVLNEQSKKEEEYWFLNAQAFQALLGGIGVLILLLLGNFELSFHSESNFGNNEFRRTLISFYNIIFGVILWFGGKKVGAPRMKQFAMVMMFSVIVLYFILNVLLGGVAELRDEYLIQRAASNELVSASKYFWQFAFHYLNVGFILISVFILLRHIMRVDGKDSVIFSNVMYLGLIIYIVFITIEFNHITVILAHSPKNTIENIIHTNWQVGFGILWAVCSFVLMIFGMRKKIREARLFALTLFSIVLSKFFIYDFWKMEPISKVVSLFIIGMLVLMISWLYNRLRKSSEEWQIAQVLGDDIAVERKRRTTHRADSEPEEEES